MATETALISGYASISGWLGEVSPTLGSSASNDLIYIQDNPYGADGSYWNSASGYGSSVISGAYFPPPSKSLVGNQKVVVVIDQASFSNGTVPSMTITINGITTSLNNYTTSNPTTKTTLFEFTFDQSLINGSSFTINMQVYGYMSGSQMSTQVYSFAVVYNYPDNVNPPSTPTNLTPSNGVSLNTLPTFSATITDSDSQAQLVVELSTNSSFSTISYTLTSPMVNSGSTATVNKQPINNGTYYWRAKAVDIGNLVSPYTSTFTITINNYSPNVPSGTSPNNGGTIGYFKPTFSAVVSDPYNDTVTIEVTHSADSTFTTGVTVDLSSTYVSSGGTASVISSKSYSDNSTIYWKARAYDGQLYSTYTSTFTLNIDNLSPYTPSNLNPANNVVVTTNSFSVSGSAVDPEGDTITLYAEVSKSATFVSVDYSQSIPTTSGTVNTFTFSNLSQGNYYWRMWAKDNNSQSSGYTAIRGIYINIPSTGNLAPDSVLANTNVSTSTNILTAVSSNDSSYTTPTDSTLSQSLRLSFPSPPSSLKTGSGLQTFTLNVQPSTTGISGITTTVQLYENGVAKGSSTTYNVGTTSSDTVINFTWDASLLSSVNGANVEILITTNSVKSGRNYGSVNIGYVTWVYQAVNQPQNPAPNVTYPTPTISSVDHYEISSLSGINQTHITFSFDSDVIQWTANVLGADYSTGMVADSGGSVTSGTLITAIVDWTELYQEGRNKVNIYGKDSSGNWTPYTSG